jgi:hypothetical protein
VLVSAWTMPQIASSAIRRHALRLAGTLQWRWAREVGTVVIGTALMSQASLSEWIAAMEPRVVCQVVART